MCLLNTFISGKLSHKLYWQLMYTPRLHSSQSDTINSTTTTASSLYKHTKTHGKHESLGVKSFPFA